MDAIFFHVAECEKQCGRAYLLGKWWVNTHGFSVIHKLVDKSIYCKL